MLLTFYLGRHTALGVAELCVAELCAAELCVAVLCCASRCCLLQSTSSGRRIAAKIIKRYPTVDLGEEILMLMSRG